VSLLTAVLGCPVCFGQSTGPMIDAARLGTWLLLGVTLLVQGAFAAFFIYLKRRARRLAGTHPIQDDWMRYQHDLQTGRQG
jgi:hypothetical protein